MKAQDLSLANNLPARTGPCRSLFRAARACVSANGRLARILLLICTFFGLLLPAPAILAASEKGAAGRIFTLLILDSQQGNPYDEVRSALAKALDRGGYVEGRNLRTMLLVTGNDAAHGERILRKALEMNRYDVIFVGGTVATISAKKVLLGDMRQSVVFGAPTDPVGIGVIKNFTGKPFSNFTGVSYPVPPKARLKFIKRLLPHARTFGLVYADMPQSASYNGWLQDLIDHDPEFKDLKIIFRSVPLKTGENGDALMAMEAAPHIVELDAQVDAFIKPNDQMGTRRQFAEIVYKTATKPLIGLARDDVMGHWGSTAVIFPSHESIGEQAARMIKDLFEGRNVADILPEWPKKFGFAIDLPKARQFRISVPVELLQLSGDNIVK
jgi:putative ABC transport system substrate-binding protein